MLKGEGGQLNALVICQYISFMLLHDKDYMWCANLSVITIRQSLALKIIQLEWVYFLDYRKGRR